jgi:hypothetical protein
MPLWFVGEAAGQQTKEEACQNHHSMRRLNGNSEREHKAAVDQKFHFSQTPSPVQNSY